ELDLEGRWEVGWLWGRALLQLGEELRGREGIGFVEEALERFSELSERFPKLYLGSLYRGIAWIERGRLAGYREGDFEKAVGVLSDLVVDFPEDYRGFYQLGRAYFYWAKGLERGQRREGLLQRAVEFFEQAAQLRPDRGRIYFYLAQSLDGLAMEREGVEADRVLRQSIEVWQRAYRAQPDLEGLLTGWGIALYHLSKTSGTFERVHFLREAIEKFQKVASPQEETYFYWGCALYELALSQSGFLVETLLEQAKGKFLEVERLSRGRGAYWLARICARQKREEELCRWLDVAREQRRLPPLEVLQREEAFAPYTSRDWWQVFLANVRVDRI
ncbi:MAG: hypothetical protein D6805_03970, partial [Planctomycetota bacterium]